MSNVNNCSLTYLFISWDFLKDQETGAFLKNSFDKYLQSVCSMPVKQEIKTWSLLLWSTLSGYGKSYAMSIDHVVKNIIFGKLKSGQTNGINSFMQFHLLGSRKCLTYCRYNSKWNIVLGPKWLTVWQDTHKIINKIK